MSNERVMRLGLTISAKQSQLTISKDVIRILGSPSYVCVLQGKDKQSVAVACCEASHPMSFKVPENLLMDNRCNMRICSQQFIDRLVEANNFSPLEFHRVEGKYLPELNAVVFPIKVMRKMNRWFRTGCRTAYSVWIFQNGSLHALLETNGLAVEKDHQFKGQYDAEKNAVVISLEENEFENEC